MTMRNLNAAELNVVAGGGVVGGDGSPMAVVGGGDSPMIPLPGNGGASPMIPISGSGGHDWWNPGWFFGPPAPEPVLPVKPVGPGFP